MIPERKFLQGNIKGLQHLGLPVSNLENSVNFYASLGFRRIMTSSVEVPEENDAIQVAMMEQNGVIIELYQVTRKEMDGLKNRKDGPVDHIAFDVKDVENVVHVVSLPCRMFMRITMSKNLEDGLVILGLRL